MSILSQKLILAIAAALALLNCAILWQIYMIGILTVAHGVWFVAIFLLVPYCIGAFIHESFVYPFDGYQGGMMVWLLISITAVMLFTVIATFF